MAGVLLLAPDLVALDLPALIRRAGYPGTRVAPAASWLLSLLALTLTRTRRVSHVEDLLLSDPAAALFAGLATPGEEVRADRLLLPNQPCPPARAAGRAGHQNDRGWAGHP